MSYHHIANVKNCENMQCQNKKFSSADAEWSCSAGQRNAAGPLECLDFPRPLGGTPFNARGAWFSSKTEFFFTYDVTRNWLFRTDFERQTQRFVSEIFLETSFFSKHGYYIKRSQELITKVSTLRFKVLFQHWALRFQTWGSRSRSRTTSACETPWACMSYHRIANVKNCEQCTRHTLL